MEMNEGASGLNDACESCRERTGCGGWVWAVRVQIMDESVERGWKIRLKQQDSESRNSCSPRTGVGGRCKAVVSALYSHQKNVLGYIGSVDRVRSDDPFHQLPIEA